MKKILITLFVICISLQISAQDCSQDENVIRFMTRGKAAIKTAEKPEDYKLAAAEFMKALEYDVKCPDIYYQLALCHEQLGKLDPGNYQEAINFLNTCLSLKPDADNKQEIREKIYEIEFLLEKAGGTSLKNLIGEWKFYWGNGDDSPMFDFDIEIYQNQGDYYVKYVLIETWRADKSGTWRNKKPDNKIDRTCKINYEDGKITFWTLHNRSMTLHNGRETQLSRREFNYELHLDENILRGTCKCSLKFEGSGNSDYSGVLKAVEAGRGRVFDNCEGDCGNNKVYFVKQ